MSSRISKLPLRAIVFSDNSVVYYVKSIDRMNQIYQVKFIRMCWKTDFGSAAALTFHCLARYDKIYRAGKTSQWPFTALYGCTQPAVCPCQASH